MARRSRKGSEAEGLILLVVLAVIFVVVPALLTAVTYGGLFFILVGLIYCKHRARHPGLVQDASDFCSPAEYSTLLSMRSEQQTLCEKKSQIYEQSDRLGLVRRSQDPARFDERKLRAKRVNASLTRLDEEFAVLASRIEALKADVIGRYETWSEGYDRWRFYSSGSKAFGVAFLCYILSATLLLALEPQWSQQFSLFVSKHIWLHTSLLSDAYGPLVLATGISVVIVPVAWSISHGARSAVLHGRTEFIENWIGDESEQSLEDFETSYGAAKANGRGEQEEEQEFSDGAPEWDGHVDEAVDCFETLGISPDASTDAIKAAYREKVKQYHLDRVASLGPKLRQLAESETKKLNAAYEEALRRR